MNILGLDTCFDACSVALDLGDKGCVASRFEGMATGHAERLVPMISEVIAEAGVPFEALDRIAVTCGPGTFTGTRIGVAAARGLAMAASKPLVTATSLWVMAEEIADGLASSDLEVEPEILIATDARREEVYCQHFKARAPMSGPAVLSPREASELLARGQPAVIAGSAAAAVLAAMNSSESNNEVIAIRPDLLPNARFLVRIGGRLQYRAEPVCPLYLRPADAKPQAGKAILRATP